VSTHSIVFTTFDSAGDRRLVGWGAFRRALVSSRQIGEPTCELESPDPGGEGDGAGATVWRLLAPNNRELGRSWAVYRSRAEAVRHLEVLRGEAHELAVIGLRGAHSSQYGWVATAAGRAVMTTGRWFGASSTGYHSAATALTAIRDAVVV